MEKVYGNTWRNIRMKKNNTSTESVSNITYTTSTINTSNSATDIIERLLREGKITAGEAMVLLEKMVNQNNSPYLPSYPTYPYNPIIYQCPSTGQHIYDGNWQVTC